MWRNFHYHLPCQLKSLRFPRRSRGYSGCSTLSPHKTSSLVENACVSSGILRSVEGPAGMSLPQIQRRVILFGMSVQAKAMIYLSPVQHTSHPCSLPSPLWNLVVRKCWSLSSCWTTSLMPTQVLMERQITAVELTLSTPWLQWSYAPWVLTKRLSWLNRPVLWVVSWG